MLKCHMGPTQSIRGKNGTKPNQQNRKISQKLSFSNPNTKINPTLGFKKSKTKIKGFEI